MLFVNLFIDAKFNPAISDTTSLKILKLILLYYRPKIKTACLAFIMISIHCYQELSDIACAFIPSKPDVTKELCFLFYSGIIHPINNDSLINQFNHFKLNKYVSRQHS